MLEASEILNASILIVDDQKTNVMLLEQMLRTAGYQRITSTMDPRAVCPLHLAYRYDLILLDLQMPGMDGFEVMEGLKEIEVGGYLPVLVITAQPGHKLRALQAGAKDFVSKPFDLIEVQTRIHNMLEVRLLYQKLGNYNKVLEQTVQERTVELRQSEARFKSFTELSSDWYWEQDPQGQFTKVSGPVFDMLGIEADGMPGAASAVLAGRWNAAERALLDANIAARRPFLDLVYSRGNADGTTQYLQVSGEPMFDSASRFIGYRGIGMEITDRRRPDQEQMRFRSAMDVIDQGICLLDRVCMRVVDANETTCRMSGYSRSELFALNLANLGIGSSENLASIFDALIAGGPTHMQTADLRRKDGSTLAATIDWRTLRVGDNWIIVGVISSYRKQLEL
ncbi:MAG: response regulator [Glaciimonas sp.]|nr:response regulator [Glaciimonas sp.]